MLRRTKRLQLILPSICRHIFSVVRSCNSRKMLPSMAKSIDAMDSGKNLRARFIANGLSEFNDHEIVELLLTYCAGCRDAKTQAQRLIDKFKSLNGLIEADCYMLEEIENIGKCAPVLFPLIRSIAAIYLEEKAVGSNCANVPTLDDWARVWALRIGGEIVERVELAFLDKNYAAQVPAIERLASGYSMSVSLIPLELIGIVLRRKCAAVILCHNHTNGSTRPSPQDERFTRAFAINMNLFGVKMIDHIVVARNSAFSILYKRALRTRVPADELFSEKIGGNRQKRKPPRRKRNDLRTF